MTKKRSKSLFVIFSIILVVCLIACFVNFTYPFAINGNYHTYSNFVSNIKLGEDIGTSLRVVYDVELHDYQEDNTKFSQLKSSTIDDFKKIIQSEGYKDVTLAEYGEDQICVQVGNILSVDDENSLIALIGNPQPISFSTSSSTDGIFAHSDAILNVGSGGQAQGDGSMGYYAVIEVTDEVAEKNVNASVYLMLGTDAIEIGKGNIQNNMISLSNENMTSSLDAKQIENQIRLGMLDLKLTESYTETITPSYGVGASVWIAVVLTILVIALFAGLIIKFKHLGWLACFNMLFFIVISLFLLQSIPLVHVNFAGIIAMALSTILFVSSLVGIFDTAKKHYQNDTKFYIALKLAQKENLFKILISNAFLALVGLGCIFMPVASIQSFGWVVMVMSFVSLFCSLALMRLFIKMYLPFNNIDGKKCNFHKGGKNA